MFSGQKIGCTFGLDKPVAKTIFVVPPLSLVKHLAGQHDQSSHGNWAHGEMPYELKPILAYHKGTLLGRYDDKIYSFGGITRDLYDYFQISDPNIHAIPLDLNKRTYDGYFASMLTLANSRYAQQTGEEATYLEEGKWRDWGNYKNRVLEKIKSDPDYPAMPKEWEERWQKWQLEEWRNSIQYRWATRDEGLVDPPMPKGGMYGEQELEFHNLNKVVSAEEFRQYALKENAFVIKKLGEIKMQSGETIKEIMDGLAKSQLSKLKKMATEQPITIQTSASRLKRLIDDGRFKTVYEVTSVGKGSTRNDYIAVRKRAETLMGVPEDIPNEQRPVYGYLANANTVNYGDVRIVLKDEVKSRTTLTVDDSLDGNAKGGFLASEVRDGKISPETFWHYSGEMTTRSIYDRNYELNFTSVKNDNPNSNLDVNQFITGSKNDFKQSTMYNYVEAQVHGGVKASDIAEVIITSETAIPKALQNKLTKQGIKIIIEPNISQIEKTDYESYGLEG